MEKEKILQQLEDKLRPSVKNLEEGQASEHDFFPSLLWVILKEDKEIQRLLHSIETTNIDNLKKAIESIDSKNKSLQQQTDNAIETKTSIIFQKIENIESILQTMGDTNKNNFKKTVTYLDNKIAKYFKWLLGIFIFQFITLTSLIVLVIIG